MMAISPLIEPFVFVWGSTSATRLLMGPTYMGT
jgi:hypothetical protein